MISDADLEAIVAAERQKNATVRLMMAAGAMFWDAILKRWFDKDGLQAQHAHGAKQP